MMPLHLPVTELAVPSIAFVQTEKWYPFQGRFRSLRCGARQEDDSSVQVPEHQVMNDIKRMSEVIWGIERRGVHSESG